MQKLNHFFLTLIGYGLLGLSIHAYAADLPSTTEDELSLATQQVALLNQQLAQAKTELAKLRKTQEQLQASLTKQQNDLSKQLRIMFALNQSQTFKTLLHANSMDNIARHLTYYRFLNQASQKQVNDIKQTLTPLAKTVLASQEQEQHLTNLLKQKQAELKDLKKDQIPS